jgi:hypothetical protein
MLALGLAGCVVHEPPAVQPLPVARHIARPPSPDTEPPPLPLHKPPAPSSRPPQPAPQTELAKVEMPPAPPPPPPPEQGPVPVLVGLDEARLAQTLGSPATTRDSPPAVIWQYVAGDCTVNVYLYRDVESGSMHALYVELNGDDRTEPRRQLCLRRLARRAGDDGAAGADPPPAR